MKRGASGILFSVIFGVLFAVAPQAHAATLYINSSTGNDTTGDGSSGAPYRSFHKAYTTASSGDTVDATGTFTWTDTLETGDTSTAGYTLSKNLTISGHGPDQTIFQASSTDNTADRRVFTVSSSYSLTLQSLTLQYGKITSGNGGCVLSSGEIVLTRVEIHNCRSTNGNGGGISTAGGIIMTGSTLYSNVTYYGGGGIHLAATTATSSILTNNTIYSNNVTSSGGAFYGGGVYASGLGNIYLTNNTITLNNAGGSYGIGGGLLIYNASLHLYLKNNFIGANTASYYAGTSDFHTYGGTIHNNGYNIIGRAESYSWATTGDWTDSNGDATYVLNTVGTTGTLNRDSAAGINSSPYLTKTWALLSGSIAINRATTTDNGTVAVPSTDQRGATRSGAPDIGAYEYDGTLEADTTPPSVSLTAPTDGETVNGSAVTFSASASDNAAVAGVRFYVDGIAQGAEDTTSTYGISWDSTSVASGSHSVVAVARDTSNNYATSSSVSITVDNAGAGISDIVVTPSSTQATITWTTDELSSSRVYFGPTSSHGTSTPEIDTSPRVTSHSVTLSNLKSCVRYNYKVQSTDALTNVASSTSATFRTLGCTGSATVSSTAQGSITTALGGTLTEGSLTLFVPTSFTASTSEAVFQAHLLDGSAFFSQTGSPSGKTRAGNSAYSLIALTDATTTLSSFIEDLTVTLSYSDEDVEGVDESTLKIYRYDDGVWFALSSCTVDTVGNIVSCVTTHFSDFAIFGDGSSTSTRRSSSTGSIQNQVQNLLAMGNTKKAEEVMQQWPHLFANKPVALAAAASPALQPASTSSTTTPLAVRDLDKGMQGSDVSRLQELLISHNAGPSARELARVGASGYFGTYTKNALGEYQKAQRILPASGYFGTMTRAHMKKILVAEVWW